MQEHGRGARTEKRWGAQDSEAGKRWCAPPGECPVEGSGGGRACSGLTSHTRPRAPKPDAAAGPTVARPAAHVEAGADAAAADARTAHGLFKSDDLHYTTHTAV